MNTWIDNPAFGIALSILCYQIGTLIFTRTRVSFFNPLLISIILIIIILEEFRIPYDTYAKGGNIINFLLAPVTVALALPMYQHWKQVRIYILPIIIGISSGCLLSIGGVILLGKYLGLNTSLINSLAPKSITTPMGIALSEAMGGNPSITVAAIVFTGILGAVIAPFVMKVFRIKSKVAKGIGIGTAAHAVGTSKAMEMGKLEGAMSSAAIGIAGVITVLLAPFLIPLIEKWLH
jgi:predicted murein hydrolase (TIGR00659 family)